MSGRRSAPQYATHSTHNMSVVTTRLQQVLDIGMPRGKRDWSEILTKTSEDGCDSLMEALVEALVEALMEALKEALLEAPRGKT